MNGKTILAIMLLLSMILVLYPLVTSLIEVQQEISDRSSVPSELVKARDNLVLQIVGFVFLYIVLAFGFNFIRFEQQQTSVETQDTKPTESHQDNPTRSQQIIEKPRPVKPKTPKVVKSLTNKTKNIIAVLSASAFMLVFVWQVFSNLTLIGTDFNTTMFFLEQAMKGIIAFLIVGIVAYIIAKYR